MSYAQKEENTKTGCSFNFGHQCMLQSTNLFSFSFLIAEHVTNGGENVAELLRLLQAIGGVERLQSLLGAQEQEAKGEESISATLPQYASPTR